jgi:hypothetical protein
VFTDFAQITIENLLKDFLFSFLFKTIQLEKKGFVFHKTFFTSLSFNLKIFFIIFFYKDTKRDVSEKHLLI